HVPNEGKRSVVNGASLKRQGLKKGVPDIFILAPKGKYHGMAIETKKIGQKPTKEQKQFLAELEKHGYYCYVANKGWSDAAEIITNYLNVECTKNEL
ncbi:MAG: VRR-NUC domain-containing protein, partial [Ruminococcus sp.]|nr:VRR-NUC domain-containing protein [Candidatus Copronaster equi]